LKTPFRRRPAQEGKRCQLDAISFDKLDAILS
jgi:hypothetical protein